MKHCIGVIVLLIAASAWGQDAERKALEGKWTPTAAELAGVKLPEVQLSTITLIIADGMYTVELGKAVDKGTLKLDPAGKPRTMDIVGTDGPNKGKTLLAIYELDKDMLRICYSLDGKQRPTEFNTSKEKPYFLATYKRGK